MWLLPAGLLAATAFELYVLQPYQEQIGMGWSVGIGAAGIGLSLVMVLAAKKQKLSSVAAVAAMLVLLAAPLYWSATPILYGGNSMLPQAGPSGRGLSGQAPPSRGTYGQEQGAGGGTNSGAKDNKDKLLEYVTKNNTGEEYLFMTTNSNTAAPYIIETGKAVIAMGGFSGNDSALTVERLKQLVADKKVKFFLIPSGSGGRGGSGEVLDWIRANSTEVPKEEWQAGSTQGGSGPMGMGNGNTLYEINKQRG